MISTGFDARVKVNQVIESQLPEFLLTESPKSVDFFKQYYISQEFTGGSSDIVENLDQYLKLDNLTPEVLTASTILSENITESTSDIIVTSTKGFPDKYGLLKIDDEIITYTGKDSITFYGCIRGFSGISSYHSTSNPEELVFSSTESSSHTSGSTVENLSVAFLKEFYKKLKFSLTPGLEDQDFVPDLNVGNFIRQARGFYQAKGTEESFRILFNILYGVTPKVVNLDNLLLKPSSASFIRREVVIAERISGNPNNLIGQTIVKSTDPTTKASISNVEILTRGKKTYYRIDLFVGFSDTDVVEGNFTISPKTRVIDTVSIGSSVITVDSTIGFPQSGTAISNDNTITYSDKTINQFLGCEGVTSIITPSTDIRFDEVYYGYENGDINLKSEVRITGVLSDFTELNKIKEVIVGENILVKNLGESIINPDSTNKTYKQLFANSWIYNTSSRFNVLNISGTTFTLGTEIDESSLKVGDIVDILVTNTQNIIFSGAIVANINKNNKQITLDNIISFVPSTSIDYDIRRRVNKASATNVDIQYGNNKIISDVQNVYNELDEYFYVASNSLPSYPIEKKFVEATITDALGGSSLQGVDVETLKYSIISFAEPVPFITGDEVIYSSENENIPGLVPKTQYYVKVLPLTNQIRLYSSRSFIEIDDYIQFYESTISGSHTFTLSSQKNRQIFPQKLLRKFPFSQNIKNGSDQKTNTGSVGLLVNGVEIINYKSDEKVYYGPIESISVWNQGENYDVINPPMVEIASNNGVQALISPVISGIVTSVLVDPQDFDIADVISATITGGNGSGCQLQPILEERYRSISFDARVTTQSGGVDINQETISFLSNHNFKDGQAIIYSNNGNSNLGVATYLGGNFDQGKYLVNGGIYYAKLYNNKTIRLHPTLTDYISGINTVGFSTINAVGIHKFRTLDPKKTLKSIKVLNSGSGYENRKLYVKPEAISTTQDWITFNNHNFKDGDLVTYSTTGSIISGLSTSNQYYIIKTDSNTFRLANAGIGGTNSSNYYRGSFVKLNSQGSGYHIFAYPEISLNINVSYASSIVGVITATPIVRGKLIDAYLYEKGSGYGSNTINLHKKPQVSIKTGSGAELKAFVVNGQIVSVQVLAAGSNYNAAPDLTVLGEGSGAVLRSKVSGGSLSDIVVINGGSNYIQETTSIKINPPGKNAVIDASIRSLTINYFNRFGDEVLLPSKNDIGYGWIGYSTSIALNEFGDDGSDHSPIIGWAYDGNPIYGPYGYSDPEDIESAIKLLSPGYNLNSSLIFDRPSVFAPGFFVEDYNYNDSGDLDDHNGRYTKTPEFPNGVYAYFTGIGTNVATNTLVPKFPYFIGDTYRSTVIEDNFLNLDQTFDFNNSNLIRNTYPYKVNQDYADNDFIIESNEITNQSLVVESTTKGSISSYEILEPGEGYSIGESAVFDNAGTNGGGLSAEISSLTGKSIRNIQTQTQTYSNVIFSWKDKSNVEATISPYHSLLNGENVSVSGLSTYVPKLTGSQSVGVSTETIVVFKEIPANSISGIVTDIYISRVSDTISIGSTIGIGTELMSVLNIFKDQNVLRVKRGVTGTAHTNRTRIDILPNKLTIPISIDYFDGNVNDKVYFNPKYSVGVGITDGSSSLVNVSIGETSQNVSVLSRSIYLPNHPFKNNQRVVLNLPPGATPISVANTSGGTPFTIPYTGLSTQTLYVVNKSPNTIGLVTSFSSLSYIVSFGSTISITNAQYSNVTGILTVTTSNPHYFSPGSSIASLSSLVFNVTDVYPTTQYTLWADVLFNQEDEIFIITTPGDYLPTGSFVVNSVIDANTFTVNAGVSLTAYNYTSGGAVLGFTTVTINNSDGLFFLNNGSNNYEYLLRSDYNQVTGKIEKNKTVVSVSTDHGLVNGDNISLNVKPSLTVGIGTSTFIKLKVNTSEDKILINPIGFGSASIDTFSSIINIPGHGYLTGDKVFYNATDLVATGLTTSSYYVYRIDDNNIKLAETYKDIQSNPPINVSIASSGGKIQEISLINPPINTIKGNNLKFELSDSSLVGYKLKIYYDINLANEFVSVGGTNFTLTSSGTIGITTDASLTINYDSNIPSKLFYALEKSGYISTADKEVINYSQISFIDSLYNGTYKVAGVGSTTFELSLIEKPEKSSYTINECEELKYSTTSLTAKGGVDKMKIVFGGFGYKRLPLFKYINSESGINANINILSNDIGNIKDIRILDQGFEYSSDKTLRPAALISPLLTLVDNTEISNVEILFAGKKYTSSPDIVVFNPVSKEIINSGSIRVNVYSSALSDIEIVERPKGLNSTIHELYTINNSNGVGISTMISGVGIITCFLSTPALGFGTAPFSIGDEIFVEGIQKNNDKGDGFNSIDHDFTFFTVNSFVNVVPAKLEFDISGVTNNPGLAKTDQLSFATIVKKSDYPIFRVTQIQSNFQIGETIAVQNSNGSFTLQNLKVTDFRSNKIKILGEYELVVGDVIKGQISGSIAQIQNSDPNNGRFETDYSLKKDFGWSTDVGKLNEDYQVIPNNDYYQNLSYTIKSPIEYETLINPVNRLLHSSGMKNFADTQISAASTLPIASVDVANITLIDLVNEERVDEIKNLDLVIDVDAISTGTQTKSKYLKFKNRKLADYIECRTNRVLLIDDISTQFSNSNLNESGYADIYNYNETYGRFLIQVKDTNERLTQLTELVVLYTDSQVLVEGIKDAQTFTLEKGTLSSNGSSLATIDGNIDQFDNLTLRFVPKSKFVDDYDIKILVNKFNTTVGGGSSANDYGVAKLYSGSKNVGAGTSETIIQFNTGLVDSFHGTIHVLDLDNNEMNYYEVYSYTNKTDVYMSEFYFDNQKATTSNSNNTLGTFTSYLSGGILKLDFDNTTKSTNKLVRSRIVGFGSTSSGIGTYRFALSGQPQERSARYDSSLVHSVGSASTTVVGVSSDIISSVKSYVKVSIGNTSAIHQVMMMHDSRDIYVLQYPFLSIGSTSGIGTFGGEYAGDLVRLKFYPDSNISGIVTITSFNEKLYSYADRANKAPDFVYGPETDSLVLSEYNGTQGDRINRLDFTASYQGYPIFSKTFDPSDSTQLELSTGIFKIKNHFFQTNERLTYSAESTFVGVDPIAVGIGSTLVGGTIITGDFLSGFSTITGVSTSTNLTVGQIVIGPSVQNNSVIVSIGQTFRWFAGNVSSGSTVITGIANTSIMVVGSGIFSGNGTSLGTLISIGINSVTASTTLPVGTGVTYYINALGVGVSLSKVSTATTFRQNYTTGILTTTCPSTVYAIKLDNDRFKLTGTNGSGIGFTFTSSGSGNAHRLTMYTRLEKSLICIDNVNQYPLSYTPLTYNLVNNGGQIGAANTIFGISGISSIRVNDVLKVDNEFMKILSFGYGSSTTGPISGIGTYLLMGVERGFSGTIATSHLDNANTRVFRGAYNIENSTIYFTAAPLGSGVNVLDSSNVKRPVSKFDGRVYLRKNYTTNKIYDDISDKFTGIGQTFRLTSQGNSTTGVEAGNGILFVNEIFQTPTTGNNAGNNYLLEENSGNTNVIFTGITSSDGSVVKSLVDVNQNQLPRGGIIVSLGSTPGLGYAALKGAQVGIITGPGGQITSIIGIGTTGAYNSLTGFDYNKTTGIATVSTASSHGLLYNDSISFRDIKFECPDGYAGFTTVGISSAFYSNVSGFMTVTTSSPHKLATGMNFRIRNLEFSCSGTYGITTTIFPDGTRGYIFTVSSIVGPNTFGVNVGTSTIRHNYVKGGVIESGITTNIFPDSRGKPFSISNFEYHKTTGVSTITFNDNHNFTLGDTIKIVNAKFDCPIAAGTTIGITSAQYSKTTGILTVTTAAPHGLGVGGTTRIFAMNFSCPSGSSGITTTIFPDGTRGYFFPVNLVGFPTQFTTNVGTSTITHNYVNGGYIQIGVTTDRFPDRDKNLQIVSIPAANKIVTNVGASTITHNYVSDGYAYAVKRTGPYRVTKVLNSTQFETNVYTVGFAHTYISGGSVSKYYNFQTGSGYRGEIGIALTSPTGNGANITAFAGIGGTLGFKINSAGSGYRFDNTLVSVPEPSYENLQIKGVSRVGIGSTTDTGIGLLLSLDVGAAATTGIGSGTFEVKNFKITRPGYAFQLGDVFTAVGLVTAKGLSNPINQFELTVVDLYSDSFASWQFGELDFIDTIKPLQDGIRTRFPLLYNGQLLSFEINENDPDSSQIDLNAVLLVYINGVPQTPGVAYQFTGGTSFIFISPPAEDAEVAIFFYRGTRNSDSVFVNVNETIKTGDTVTVAKNNDIRTTSEQNSRVVYDISSADKIQTNIYSDIGIDETNYKPVNWKKQKSDRIIGGDYVYKTRDSLESAVYPTAKIIKNLSTTDTDLFVDDARFFNYEENESAIQIGDFDAIITNTPIDPVAARLTATVSAAGTISTLNIVDGGSGYSSGTAIVKIAAPKSIGIGIGTTAVATATVLNGSIVNATITNGGFGYVQSNPPSVLASVQKVTYEEINNISGVNGFSGIITGITTTTGTGGHPLALKLFLKADSFNSLLVNYPIYVFDTSVGKGVTSVDGGNSSIVGLGTTFADNIYYIHSITPLGSNAEVVTNIHSATSVVGLATTGSNSNPVGKFSWGKFSGFSRSSTTISIGVTGLTANSGLSSFPSIQRRGFGLRDGGGLRKILV